MEVVVRCFAIPANIRWTTEGWRARLSICMSPRVYGQAGSYVLVSSVDALENLPERLRCLAMQVTISGIKRPFILPKPGRYRADLWSWSRKSFVEVQSLHPAKIGAQDISTASSPTRYSRGDLATLMLGAGVGKKANSKSRPRFTVGLDGYYPAFTAASLGGVLREGLPDGLYGDLKGTLLQALGHSTRAHDLTDVSRPPRASVLERFDQLSRMRSNPPQPETIFAEFHCFHQLHEGPEKLSTYDLMQRSVGLSATGDDANHRMILTTADTGRLLVVASVYSVEIVLPQEGTVQVGMSIRVRNILGAFRISTRDTVYLEANTSRSIFRNKTTEPYVELAKGWEYTLTRASSGWGVSTPEIDITITNTQHGLILEKEERQGVRVLVPALSPSDAGFSITTVNRGGRMTLTSSGTVSTFRRIPKDLIEASQHSELSYGRDVAIQLRWDGAVWNAVPETTDDEFHRSVSGLNSYPALIREVGLIWDVELPLSDEDLQNVSSSEGLVSLSVNQGDSGIRITPYAVAFDLRILVPRKYIAFLPAPNIAGKKGGAMPVHTGFLDLSSCTANQAELDVPVRTLFARAESQKEEERYRRVRLKAELSYDEEIKKRAEFARKSYRPEYAADVLPALTEAGIELAHPTWHQAQQQAVVENTKLEVDIRDKLQRVFTTISDDKWVYPESADVFYQENITLGSRYDALDVATGQWRSLCEQAVMIRRGTMDGREEMRCDEEGFITAGAMGEATVVNSDQTITHVTRASDVIFRWTGWGVTLPRPFSGTVAANEQAVGGLGLFATHIVPTGSQYKQRIGNQHQFRARLVDIAGNSWSSKEADEILEQLGDELLSPAITVRRLQPSNAPTVLQKSADGLAPVRALVIRSYDKKTAEPAEYGAYCPRVGFELMQLLGTTDGVSKDVAMKVLRRAHLRSIAMQPSTEGASVLPPKGTLWSKHLTIEDPDVRGIAWRFLPGNERRRSSDQNSEEHLTLSSESSSLTIASPLITKYRRIRLPSGQRHAIAPIRIMLKSGRKRASRVQGKELHITLPPGDHQQVVISSAIYADSLKNFDLFMAAASIPSIKAVNSSATFDRLLQNAADGASPMLTPNIVIQVVHASQRPVKPPLLYPLVKPGRASDASNTAPTIIRHYGQTEVSIDFTYFVHSPSTGRIDIEAQWVELEDIPANRAWTHVKKHELVDHWSISSSDLTFFAPEPMTEGRNLIHRLPDTRRRLVRYTAVATSRHAEFFNRLTTDNMGRQVRIPGMQASPQDPYLEDTDFQVRSEEMVLDIPNSLEPPQFEIEYIIPKSMIRETHKFGGHIQSVDTTWGLTVYARRPAAVTGLDEMLGVLVAASEFGAHGLPPKSSDSSEADAVSEMAEDPLSLSLPIAEERLKRLTPDFFPNPDEPARLVKRRAIEPEKRVRGSMDRTTTVLGYTIHEMPDEDLLYADVPIGPTHRAAPFLRLALVRYQPHSVEGAHVSNRATLAFVRPSADRTLNVQFQRVNENPFSIKRKLRIAVIGPAGMNDKGEVDSDMTLTLTRRRSSSVSVPFKTEQRGLSKKWAMKSQFIAEWSIEFNVDQYLQEEEDGSDDRLRGHCEAHITEQIGLINTKVAKWFTDFGLGFIRWDDQ